MLVRLNYICWQCQSFIGMSTSVVKATHRTCKKSSRKIHQNNEPLSMLIQKVLPTHKCVPISSQGVSFPLLSFQLERKKYKPKKKPYLEICAFHIPLRIQNNYREHNFNLNFTRCLLNVHVGLWTTRNKKLECYKLQSHERKSCLIERWISQEI